jgi:hypothetical protein
LKQLQSQYSINQLPEQANAASINYWNNLQCSVNQLLEQLKLKHQSIIMHVTGYQQQYQSFISDYHQLELAINTSYI